MVDGAAPIATWLHLGKTWEQMLYLIHERQPSNLGLGFFAGDNWGFFLCFFSLHVKK